MMFNPFDYEDTAFCEHCQAETTHRFRGDGHERDSSGDMTTCLVCGYWESGMSIGLNPPSTEADYE